MPKLISDPFLVLASHARSQRSEDDEIVQESPIQILTDRDNLTRANNSPHLVDCMEDFVHDVVDDDDHVVPEKQNKNDHQVKQVMFFVFEMKV